MTHYLRFIVLALVIPLFTTYAFAGNIKTGNEGKTDLRMISKSETNLQMVNHIGEIGTVVVSTEKGSFSRLILTGYTKSIKTGNPDLPVRRQLIEIPFGAKPKVRIIGYDVREYNLSDYGLNNPLMPAQPPQPKCGIAPPFAYNTSQYQIDAFTRGAKVSVDVLGIMRGVRIARINIHPIAYNPVKNMIRVYENLEFEITFEDADPVMTRYEKQKTYSPYFQSLFQQLINYSPLSPRDSITKTPVKYVIISDRMFESQLQSFIAWKKEKGFIVDEAYTDDIGSTKQEIKDYIQGLYDNGTDDDPAPSFVLFVGDVGQIPAWDNGNGVTDRNYVEYTGDVFPEIYYGRFSANSTSELQPFIDKSLEYEEYTMPDPSYLENVVMIAGVDSGHGNDWGNGQINYGTENYFNESHDINSYTYLYPESGSHSADIIQNISDGVTFANYTAHGSSDGWYNPSFTISDIPTLQNQDKYGLLIGNCCLTSTFGGTCFGEEIVRAEDKGAVGYIGGSNSTYWDEDYYFGVGVGQISEDPPSYEETTLGNYDRAFHDHDEPFSDWYVTMDQHIFAGNLAVSESGSSAEQYYWDIYNLMGDPSLMIYYGVPDEMTVDHADVMLIGSTSFDITAAPHAYIALNQDGENITVTVADDNGNATLTFDPLTTPGTAQLVITAQNYQPYFEDVPVIAPNGPYCIYKDLTINDDSLGNGNNHPEFDESVFLSIAVENYGTEDADSVNVTISTTNTYITLLDDQEFYDTIPSGETVTRENGFEIQLADNIPDQMEINFDLTVTDQNDSSWVSDFSLISYAPVLTPLEMTVEGGDGNGRLDPGETAILKIKTANTGHCVINNVLASLEAYNPFITVLSGDTIIPVLGLLGAAYPEYEVKVADDAPEGVFGEMHYTLQAGGYTAVRSYFPKIGLLSEDWETGDFNKFDWKFDGDADWTINTVYPHGGLFDAKSGTITDNQTSELYITYEVMNDDTISFYKKVSSEPDYDFLEFYIDNTLKDKWSGTNQGWKKVAYAVSPGVHTFRWVYSKDWSGSNGSDCGWIDDILLPTMMVTTVYAGPDNDVCANAGYFQCLGTATNYDSIFWVSSGDGTFSDDNILTPQYTPGDTDVSNGSVLLSLNLIDVDGNPASDTMTLNFDPLPVQPALPVGPEDVSLKETTASDYTVDLAEYADTYSWSLYPEEAGTISGDTETGHVEWNTDYWGGEAWVKVAGNNSCGQGIFSDSLNIIVSDPVGIPEQKKELAFAILPNPNNGTFKLSVQSDGPEPITIKVINYQGKALYTGSSATVDRQLSENIDLSMQPAGVYFVIIQQGDIRQVKKLLINR